MKANEFVKLVGLTEAKRIIRDNEIKGRYRHLNVCHVDLAELYEIVESHDLIKSCGGLEKSRLKVQGNRLSYKKTAALWKAILDVESCQ